MPEPRPLGRYVIAMGATLLVIVSTVLVLARFRSSRPLSIDDPACRIEGHARLVEVAGRSPAEPVSLANPEAFSAPIAIGVEFGNAHLGGASSGPIVVKKPQYVVPVETGSGYYEARYQLTPSHRELGLALRLGESGSAARVLGGEITVARKPYAVPAGETRRLEWDPGALIVANSMLGPGQPTSSIALAGPFRGVEKVRLHGFTGTLSCRPSAHLDGASLEWSGGAPFEARLGPEGITVDVTPGVGLLAWPHGTGR